ncbi:DUF3068 domain-containing protein [Actinomadura viridis]|uniref:DUF3068 domain-containing protein n=1 Tax=Actinomadura viridis TaxID=58110 RepID=UPI0036B7A998
MAVSRKISPILVACGVFSLTLAALFRVYAAPRLITAPADIYQTTTLYAKDATYLDAPAATVRRGATIKAVNTVRGDVKASDSRIAVWDSFTWVADAEAAGGPAIDMHSQRVAFDRRTARLLNVRRAAVNGDTRVRQSGIGMFWPIGVKKQTYQVFDTKTGRPHPMTFAGVERIHGVRVYRFVQRIGPVAVGTQPVRVPAWLLGLKEVRKGFPGHDAKAGDVAVDRVYQGTITAWVDPRTGTRVAQEQHSRTVLRTKDGVDRLVAGDLRLKMTDADQKERAAAADRTARKVALIRTRLPLAAAVLGAAFLATAFGRARSRRRLRTAAPAPASGPAPAPEPASAPEPTSASEPASASGPATPVSASGPEPTAPTPPPGQRPGPTPGSPDDRTTR